MHLSASQQCGGVGAWPPYQSRTVGAAVTATRKVPGGRINSVLAHRSPPSRGEQGGPPSDDSSATRASRFHVRERRASPAKPKLAPKNAKNARLASDSTGHIVDPFC